VLPFRIHFQVVKEEPTEQAILGTGDQAMYLPGGAGEDGGQTGRGDIHVFPVRAAVKGDRLMMKSLTITVAVVSVLTFQNICKCISFSFENKAPSLILSHELKYARSTAVGGEQQHFLLGFLGFFCTLFRHGCVIE